MKRIFSLSLCVLIAAAAFAQPGKKPASPPAAPKINNQHLNVYNLCMVTGDYNTAISALNYYVVEQKGNTPYADTLALLYLQQGAYAQCYFWADRRLAASPDNLSLMEMKAICLDKGQQPREAITLYEKLFAKTQKPYHAYKLMELQYGIKRLAECLATANAAERLEYKPDMTMTYTFGEQVGRTYLQAGVFNIHGLALYDDNKKQEAKIYFEKALQLDSTFALARQNLEAVKAELAGKTNNNPAPGGGAPPANKQN